MAHLTIGSDHASRTAPGDEASSSQRGLFPQILDLDGSMQASCGVDTSNPKRGCSHFKEDHSCQADSVETSDVHRDQLEVEAHRRAIDGKTTDIIHSAVSPAHPATGSFLVTRKYNDALLMMLLKANRSEQRRTTKTPETVPDDIALDPDPPRVMRGKST